MFHCAIRLGDCHLSLEGGPLLVLLVSVSNSVPISIRPGNVYRYDCRPNLLASAGDFPLKLPRNQGDAGGRQEAEHWRGGGEEGRQPGCNCLI